MGSILVSVVVDCYNHESYVEAALASVLSQKWGDIGWELIVVDDGSTDATAARARKFAPGARVIEQANSGQAQAFNAAVREAKGELICFLDGDDLWYPGKAAAVVREFAEHPEAVLVQHALETVDAAGKVLARPRSRPPAGIALDDVLAGRDVLVGTSGLSVRRSAFEKIAPVPKDLTIYADEYLSKHALFFGAGRTVPAILGGLRIHESNSFQGQNWRPDKIERFLAISDRLETHLAARLKERGLSLSPEGRRAKLLERRTKEILLFGWRGERARAFAAWRALGSELAASSFSSFKRLTLLLAVVSPRLYLTLHGAYAGSGWLPSARMKLLKESS